MKLCPVIIAAVLADKKISDEQRIAQVDEQDYDVSNWLDAEFETDADFFNEEEDEYSDEVDKVAYDADNWLDVEWPEEDAADEEEEDEAAEENDFASDNWLDIDWDEVDGNKNPEFTWHGDESLASYETCCGEPYSKTFHDDTDRSAAMMFDDNIWSSWKSYQPGNPQYSVTVDFKKPIVFREVRLVPNPIPFGVWWYNKQLQGVCVYVDDVKVDCTADDFELPAEPQEFDYKNSNDPAYVADHARWEALREQFYLSFSTDNPAGLTGKSVKVITKLGQEASYGDLKILYDGTGVQSYRLIESESEH